MSYIRATALPQIRDRMATLLTDPASVLRAPYELRNADAELAKLDRGAEHLAAGRLYWATADMAALAVSAGAALDAVSWAVDDRIHPTGLMVMDGGIGRVPNGGVIADRSWLPADAVSWGPHPEGMQLIAWQTRARLEDEFERLGDPRDTSGLPRLVPIDVFTLPAAEVVVEELGELRSALSAVYAAWRLMQQPTLTQTTDTPADKKIAHAYDRAGRAEPAVAIVDLRKIYRPSEPAHAPDEQPHRYSHRWVVTGHWRNQAHGPGRELRKPIWIVAHNKGPDGAPLLVRERVNVWRR